MSCARPKPTCGPAVCRIAQWCSRFNRRCSTRRVHRRASTRCGCMHMSRTATREMEQRPSSVRSSASPRASPTSCSPVAWRHRKYCRRTTPTTSAATSPVVRTTDCSWRSGRRSRHDRTSRPTRRCSCVRHQRPPARACTGCAAGTLQDECWRVPFVTCEATVKIAAATVKIVPRRPTSVPRRVITAV